MPASRAANFAASSASLLLAAALSAAAGPVSPGPTLAREDTLTTSVPEIIVRAPRVTLDEILDRIARGERRRDSLMVDQSFVATMRVMGAKTEAGPGYMVEESAWQVYRRKPNLSRSLMLRRTTRKPEKPKDKKNVNVEVSFGGDMSEKIVNHAFRPEERRNFRYRILGRDIVGGHVIYRIRFEPKSLLDPSLPSGLVWVDANEFVILRQEVEFERSPVPLIIKDIDHIVIERVRIGEFWMLHKVLMRAKFRFPVPDFGRRADFALMFDRYTINAGVPDSVFVGVEKP